MKSIFGTLIVGMALLMVGCATNTPPTAAALKQGEVCTAVGGGVWPSYEDDGSFSSCELPKSWQIELSNADKLACVRAGGIPKVNGRYDVYLDCPGDPSVQCHTFRTNVSCNGKVVTQQVRQQAPASQPTWTPLPYPNIDTFQKPDRGTTCHTTCNSYGSCTTRC